ncbi:MAG: amidohydrolase [Desulfobacteraceae bacterium]|nr:amidohydrolase [Desulfobacteraceae bacterium]
MECELLPFHNWLVELRRHFHRFPEPAYQEEKTGAKICEILTSFHIPFHTGIGKTGIVARLKAKHPGKTIAFRADMDALKMEEANDLPYKSQHPGLMHACGHDGHITIALGIIRLMIESGWIENGQGESPVYFQPAEEGGAGAKAMLDSGFFDNEAVEAIFAGHVHPEYPTGDVSIVYGVSNAASDSFGIRLTGRGGHGAHPYQCKDVILIASYLIVQLQALVSREISALDSVVITIGKFHAGTASNIIPEHADIEGTIRTLNEDIRQKMFNRMRELLNGFELAYGISAAFHISERGYPVLNNHSELVKHAECCAKAVLGEDHVHSERPRMGAEDFAFFCRKWRGMMMGIGCHYPDRGFCYGLHSPHF